MSKIIQDIISIHASMKEATKRCPRCHKRILEGGDYAEEIQTEEYGEGGDKMDWPVTQSYVDSDRGVW